MLNNNDNRSVGGKTKRNNARNSDIFEHSNIANFSDDAIGVLGWKATGILACIILGIVGVFLQL